MPQAGIHAIVGTAARRWFPRREWLALGIVLGNMVPDLDNLAVAAAVVTGTSTEGLHRTFSHSVFFALAITVLSVLAAALLRRPNWKHLGLGLGAGILMHTLLDLVAWFNGVELFWPLRYELDLWSWFVVPEWLAKLLETGELLGFGLFFWVLSSMARRQHTDADAERGVRRWAYIMLGLFGVFTVLDFTLQAGFLTLFGAAYLLALFLAFGIAIRMRRTIEAI